MIDLTEGDRQVLLAADDFAALGVRPTVDLLHHTGLGSRRAVGAAMQRLEAAGYICREQYLRDDGSWEHHVAVTTVSGLC